MALQKIVHLQPYHGIEDMFRNMQRFFKSQNIELPSSIACMPGRVGLPMPGTKVHTDAQGAISVYGPHVFKGYLHDQRQTEAALDRNGYALETWGPFIPVASLKLSVEKKTSSFSQMVKILRHAILRVRLLDIHLSPMSACMAMEWHIWLP